MSEVGPFDEARMLSSLRHPCIMSLYGVDIEEGSLAMAVDYVRGGSLKDGLASLVHSVGAGGDPKAALMIRRVKASVAAQAARGMEYLHRNQIVHFDLAS